MEAKNLLKEYGLKPSKGLGQHFLIGQGVLKKIIQTAGLKTTDIVLEIGPGLGILTRELAKMVKKVIAVEKDQRLCRILERELKNFKNLKIIQDDILKSNIQYPISNIQSNSYRSAYPGLSGNRGDFFKMVKIYHKTTSD